MKGNKEKRFKLFILFFVFFVEGFFLTKLSYLEVGKVSDESLCMISLR